jgi:hypothetical protein
MCSVSRDRLCLQRKSKLVNKEYHFPHPHLNLLFRHLLHLPGCQFGTQLSNVTGACETCERWEGAWGQMGRWRDFMSREQAGLIPGLAMGACHGP